MASFLGKATGPTGGRDGTLHYGRLDLNIHNPLGSFLRRGHGPLLSCGM